MLKAYRYRIYPNQEQKVIFAKTFGCTRFVYNKMLAERKEIYEKFKDDKEQLKQQKPPTPAKYKQEFEWLKEVDSLALANAQLNLQRAFKNFFRDKNVGYPKFKSKHKSKMAYTTNNQNGTIAIVDGKYLKLPKIKSLIRIKQHRQLKGKIKSATITKEPSGKYYASILCEEDIQQLPPSNNAVGYDLGIVNYAVGSNGDTIDNPRYFQKEQQKLAKEQRKLARKVKGSNNYKKQRIKVARQHERIANLRRDFLHKESTRIIHENQVIVLEDLQIKKMLEDGYISKQISDASWRTFRDMLEYKSNWYGRSLVLVDKDYPSSQLCSTCGYENKTLPLGKRKWRCSQCHAIHDRDANAAKNILAEGLRILAA